MRCNLVLSVLLVGLSTFGAANGAEYKGAKIKKISDKLVVTFDADGKEVSVTAFPFMKGFDESGKELRGPGEGLRVLKEGNVVDIKTESLKVTGKAQLYISEGRLIKGELLDLKALKSAAGKRPSKKPGDTDMPTYTVVKAESKGPVVLRASNGAEVSVVPLLKKAFDAEGKPLPDDQLKRVLKEGNILEVKLSTANKDRQVLSEARLVSGELADESSTSKRPAAPEVFAEYRGARIKMYGFKGSVIEVDGKEVLIGTGTPVSKYLDEKGEPITGSAAHLAAFKPGTQVDVIVGPPPKKGDGKPVVLEMRLVK